MANIDSNTKIPFTYLVSRPDSSKGTKSAGGEQKSQFLNVVVFAFDFWDNYIPLILRLKILLEKTVQQTGVPLAFLLMNFPGQAFTICDPEKALTNHEGAKCIDQILYILDSEGEINLLTDRLHMFGVGFGANICIMYCSLENYCSNLLKKRSNIKGNSISAQRIRLHR